MKLSVLLAAGAALALAGCATALEEIEGENWSGPRLTTQRYTPPVAAFAGRKGLVFLRCLRTPELRVTDCEVVYENPTGMGFGEAALRMQSQVVIRSEVFPEKKTVTLPVLFCPDGVSCGAERKAIKELRDRQAAERAAARTPGA